MSIAILSSFRSKDRKTQNGACIVNQDKKIIGTGYNGLPYGCDDNDAQYWSDNDDNLLLSKHTYVVHAEQNAIYNSIPHKMEGASIYTTQYPCNICTQAIIQVGIKEIVYLTKKTHHQLMNQAVGKMLQDANIQCLEFNAQIDDLDKQFMQALIHTKTLYQT